MFAVVLAEPPTPAPPPEAAGLDWALIATVASPVVAALALVVAVLARADSRRSSQATVQSAEAAKKSAETADRTAVLQEEAAALERFDRHDAAGPSFEPVHDAQVGDDLKALVKLKIVGGPGEIELELEARAAAWCAGLSSTRDGTPGIVLIPAHEPGDTVTFFVHLSGRPWADDDPVMLAVMVSAETSNYRRWYRRVSVPVVPERGPWVIRS